MNSALWSMFPLVVPREVFALTPRNTPLPNVRRSPVHMPFSCARRTSLDLVWMWYV